MSSKQTKADKTEISVNLLQHFQEEAITRGFFPCKINSLLKNDFVQAQHDLYIDDLLLLSQKRQEKERQELKDPDSWLLMPSSSIGQNVREIFSYSRISPLGDVLKKIEKNNGWDQNFSVVKLHQRWQDVVGEQCYQHWKIEDFSKGVITIRTTSTAWRKNLELVRGMVLAKISQVIGDGIVLELKILGPARPSWKHGKFSVTGGRGPRDTYN